MINFDFPVKSETPCFQIRLTKRFQIYFKVKIIHLEMELLDIVNEFLTDPLSQKNWHRNSDLD